MKRALKVSLIFGGGLLSGAVSFALPPDLTGVWMPTAIAPDGSRNRTWPERPPFLPAAQAAIDLYYEEYDPVEDDAGRSCLPSGIPRQMLTVAQYPIEIIQTEGQITIIFELHNNVRRIFVDGRSHPDDVLPSWMGHSIGHYENDTLVVETKALRRSPAPRPSSAELTVTERFELVDGDSRGPMLVVDIAIDDPRIYAEPFSVRNYFWKQTDIEMGEYFCSEDIWRQSLTGNTESIPWR